MPSANPLRDSLRGSLGAPPAGRRHSTHGTFPTKSEEDKSLMRRELEAHYSTASLPNTLASTLAAPKNNENSSPLYQGESLYNSPVFAMRDVLDSKALSSTEKAKLSSAILNGKLWINQEGASDSVIHDTGKSHGSVSQLTREKERLAVLAAEQLAVRVHRRHELPKPNFLQLQTIRTDIPSLSGKDRQRLKQQFLMQHASKDLRNAPLRQSLTTKLDRNSHDELMSSSNRMFLQLSSMEDGMNDSVDTRLTGDDDECTIASAFHSRTPVEGEGIDIPPPVTDVVVALEVAPTLEKEYITKDMEFGSSTENIALDGENSLVTAPESLIGVQSNMSLGGIDAVYVSPELISTTNPLVPPYLTKSLTESTSVPPHSVRPVDLKNAERARIIDEIRLKSKVNRQRIRATKEAARSATERAVELRKTISTFRSSVRAYLVEKRDPRIGDIMRCLDDGMVFHLSERYGGLNLTPPQIVSLLANSLHISEFIPNEKTDNDMTIDSTGGVTGYPGTPSQTTFLPEELVSSYRSHLVPPGRTTSHSSELAYNSLISNYRRFGDHFPQASINVATSVPFYPRPEEPFGNPVQPVGTHDNDPVCGYTLRRFGSLPRLSPSKNNPEKTLASGFRMSISNKVVGEEEFVLTPGTSVGLSQVIHEVAHEYGYNTSPQLQSFPPESNEPDLRFTDSQISLSISVPDTSNVEGELSMAQELFSDSINASPAAIDRSTHEDSHTLASVGMDITSPPLDSAVPPSFRIPSPVETSSKAHIPIVTDSLLPSETAGGLEDFGVHGTAVTTIEKPNLTGARQVSRRPLLQGTVTNRKVQPERTAAEEQELGRKRLILPIINTESAAFGKFPNLPEIGKRVLENSRNGSKAVSMSPQRQSLSGSSHELHPFESSGVPRWLYTQTSTVPHVANARNYPSQRTNSVNRTGGRSAPPFVSAT